MSDRELRQLEREWRAGDPQAALAYLRLKDRVSPPAPMADLVFQPCKFEGRKQANCSEAVLSESTVVLRSYESIVAIREGDLQDIVYWSPARAFSSTSKRHVSRWTGWDAVQIIVSEAELDERIERARRQ